MRTHAHSMGFGFAARSSVRAVFGEVDSRCISDLELDRSTNYPVSPSFHHSESVSLIPSMSFQWSTRCAIRKDTNSHCANLAGQCDLRFLPVSVGQSLGIAIRIMQVHLFRPIANPAFCQPRAPKIKIVVNMPLSGLHLLLAAAQQTSPHLRSPGLGCLGPTTQLIPALTRTTTSCRILT